MTREQYVKFAREKLKEHKLEEWGVRLSTDASKPFVGLCSYRDRTIILNAHHIDIHPEPEVIDTIMHEIAHALVGPTHGHDDVWRSKAHELGCTNFGPCPAIPPHLIDAIRSGDLVEVEYEEIVEVKRIPTYKVTRLQDKCPECFKVAKETSSFEEIDELGNAARYTTLECGHIIKKILPRQTPFHKMVSNFWKENVEQCEHEWDGTKCVKCREFKLYPFQIAGAQFAENAVIGFKGVGIFDEMGLGKTVQCMAYIKYHLEESLPILFVVKSGLKFQFGSEILRWLGPDYVPQILSTAKERFLPGMGTYIISYDLLRRMPAEKMQAVKFRLVVLDECQQIKNPDSTRTQEVRKLLRNQDTKVIALSGTPWKNRGSEFFPVLNMLDPMKFHSHAGFIARWVDYYWEGTRRKEGGIINVARFKEYVKDIVIRRERTEVMSELPLINRTKLNFELEDIEKKTYNEEVGEFVKWYNDYVMEGREDQIDALQMLAKMSRMRHIVGLAKIPATLAFVEEFVEDSENKLVIFVHHKDVGQIIYDSLTKEEGEWKELVESLKSQGIAVYRLTADLSSEERYRLQVAFNEKKRAILVASTLASGEGLNLQTCADCVMHERQWNPANEEQAEGRFIRIGQVAQSVNATYTEAKGTIDSHFDAIIEQKRAQYHQVMNKGEAPVWSQNAVVKELAAAIVAKFKKDNSGKKFANLVK